MALTPNGRVLWPLFSSLVSLPIGLATGALSYFPIRPLTKLVSLLAAQSGQPAEVTASLVGSPATVRAALSMAAEEMSEVTELDGELLKEHGDKMWWYWARDGLDGWVAESSVVEIEGVLDEAGHEKAQRERCGEGMKHAFCLREGELSNALLTGVSGRAAERKLTFALLPIRRSRRVASQEGRRMGRAGSRVERNCKAIYCPLSTSSRLILPSRRPFPGARFSFGRSLSAKDGLDEESQYVSFTNSDINRKRPRIYERRRNQTRSELQAARLSIAEAASRRNALTRVQARKQVADYCLPLLGFVLSFCSCAKSGKISALLQARRVGAPSQPARIDSPSTTSTFPPYDRQQTGWASSP